MHKEALLERLRVAIDDYYRRAEGAAGTATHLEAIGLPTCHGQREVALLYEWRASELGVVRAHVQASAYDDCSKFAARVKEIEDNVGYDVWLALFRSRQAAEIEREVTDAQRCFAGEPGMAMVRGVALLAWRAMTDEQKRAAVADWHGRGPRERPSRVAKGELWPTSTFDLVPWACSEVKHLGTRGLCVAVLECEKREHHDSPCSFDMEALARSEIGTAPQPAGVWLFDALEKPRELIQQAIELVRNGTPVTILAGTEGRIWAVSTELKLSLSEEEFRRVVVEREPSAKYSFHRSVRMADGSLHEVPESVDDRAISLGFDPHDLAICQLLRSSVLDARQGRASTLHFSDQRMREWAEQELDAQRLSPEERALVTVRGPW